MMLAIECVTKSIKDDVERLARRQYIAQRKNETQRIKQETAGYADRVNPDFAKAPAVAKNEEYILGLMLLYPDHRKRVFEQQLLTANDFYTELNKRIFEFIKKCYDLDEGVDDLNESFTPEEIGRITKMKINRMQLAENGPSVLTESINSLHASMQRKNAEAVSSIDDLNKLINSMRK